jgi:triosephosphate isomerase
MARKKLMAGNWKMHKTRAEASEFCRLLSVLLGDVSLANKAVDIALGVPSTIFDTCVQGLGSRGVKILAQNVHYESQGAFTGEISVAMINDCHLQGSIIGHSERRQYFGETDESVGKKWNALSLAGLWPVVCVGETRQQREAGATNAVVQQQFEQALSRVSSQAQGRDFIVAYEPVWAIGTGLTATPAQAEEVHVMIRDLVAKHFGRERSQTIRILYGGSMNPGNCAELLKQPNIDGGLIGGASLKPEDFSKMILTAKGVMIGPENY